MSATALDLRGLEPPEPLVRSVEAAEKLAIGEELLVTTTRRPLHLLSLLAGRGFELQTTDRGECHETRVRRPQV